MSIIKQYLLFTRITFKCLGIMRFLYALTLPCFPSKPFPGAAGHLRTMTTRISTIAVPGCKRVLASLMVPSPCADAAFALLSHACSPGGPALPPMVLQVWNQRPGFGRAALRTRALGRVLIHLMSFSSLKEGHLPLFCPPGRGGARGLSSPSLSVHPGHVLSCCGKERPGCVAVTLLFLTPASLSRRTADGWWGENQPTTRDAGGGLFLALPC